MNLRLTRQQEQLVKQQIAAGRRLSEAEMIRGGVRLLADEMEWRADTPRRIAIGMEQLRAGQVVDGAQAASEVLENVRRRRTRARGA